MALNRKITLLIYIIFISYIEASTVLATVGKEEIKIKDVTQYLQAVAPGVKYETLKPQEQKLVRTQMIDRKIILIIAKNEKIKKHKRFKEDLKFIIENFTIDYLMKEKAKNIKVSDKKTKKYFKTNKAKFEKPKRFLVSHILVKDAKKAKSIIKKLDKVPSSKINIEFKKFAEEHSMGPSKKNGGSLGWITERDTLPGFYKVLKDIPKGSISKRYAKTSFGFHIILVLDIEEKQVMKFDAIKEKLHQALVLEELKEKLSKEVEQVKKFIKVSIK